MGEHGAVDFGLRKKLAEREDFKPPNGDTRYTLSKRAPDYHWFRGEGDIGSLRPPPFSDCDSSTNTNQ